MRQDVCDFHCTSDEWEGVESPHTFSTNENNVVDFYYGVLSDFNDIEMDSLNMVEDDIDM